MRIVAYCTQDAAQAVAKATGTTPLTSPPLLAMDVTLEMLAADLLYFRLHGTESNTDVWFGDDGEGGLKPIALRLEMVSKLKLDDATVVVANCYGAASPFVWAFYEAGARTVIAIPGENYAGGRTVMGADLLVQMITWALRRGRSLATALRFARWRLRLVSWQRRRTKTGKIVYPNKDTLEFAIVPKEAKT